MLTLVSYEGASHKAICPRSHGSGEIQKNLFRLVFEVKGDFVFMADK